MAAMLAIGFVACNPDKPKPIEEEKAALIINITPKWGTQTLEYFTNYTTQAGNLISIETLKFFIDEIELKKADGTWLKVADIAFLDYAVESNKKATFSEIPEGTYEGIRFMMGVDSISNHADPATFPNDHPLNPLVHKTMHWGWNPGYIFSKVEGRYMEGGLSKTFSYHLGLVKFTRNLQFENQLIQIKKGANNLNFNLLLDKYFNAPNQIDVYQSPVTHTMGDNVLAPKLYENTANIITIVNP